MSAKQADFSWILQIFLYKFPGSIYNKKLRAVYAVQKTICTLPVQKGGMRAALPCEKRYLQNFVRGDCQCGFYSRF